MNFHFFIEILIKAITLANETDIVQILNII